MKTVYHKISFHEFTGHDFKRERLTEGFLSRDTPFDKPLSVNFGKGKAIGINESNLELYAAVEQPSYDFSKKTIEDYMSKYKFENIMHESKSHRARVLPDGQASFEYLVNGEQLNRAGDVYLTTFKGPDQVKEQAKKWSAMANKLGFEPSLPKTLPLENGCEAVKVCTKFIRLEQDKIIPYTTNNLLKAVSEDNSKLLISSSSSSLIAYPKEVRLDLCYRPSKDDVDFAIDMMGEIKKEPDVRWGVNVNIKWDQFRESFEAHKDDLGTIGIFSIFPAVCGVGGAVIGIKEGLSLPYGLAGAGIGGAIDLALVGGAVGSEWRNERKYRIQQEKERAHQEFEEFARSQEHLKHPYGSCVVVSTDKCIRKVAKKKESEEN